MIEYTTVETTHYQNYDEFKADIQKILKIEPPGYDMLKTEDPNPDS